MTAPRLPSSPWGLADHVVSLPDLAATGRRASDLEVRGASLRGSFHTALGEERQDCYGVAETERHLLVAVADGVGSCGHSALGAEIAVRAALRALADVDETSTVVGADLLGGPTALLQDEAERLGCRPRDLSTTLVAAAVRRDPEDDGTRRCLVVVAGDSPALVIGADGSWSPLTPPADQPSNVVDVHLPTAPGGAAALGVALAPGAILVLCSDGFAVPLGDGREGVGPALAARWGAGPRQPLQFAIDLSFEGHHDDRTVVAVWAPPAPAPGDGSSDGAGAPEEPHEAPSRREEA